jgi:hypothetical protein
MKKTWQFMVVTATASAFLFTRTPIALALDNASDNSNYSFPLNTRATLWGTAGNEPWGQGDFMFPLWGNEDSFLFTDGTGKYGDDHAWLGSMGLGVRSLVNDKIWGGYLFGDQDVLGDGSHFFVLNPGVELITLNWDARLNGYFPAGHKNDYGGTAWGDQIGIATFVRFQGHTEFDHLFALTDSVGNGGDIEIGRTFQSLNQTRVYLGGYLTSPKVTQSIQGIQGGIQVPLMHRWIVAELADSYDNQQHNTAVVSLRFSFGDIPTSSPPEVHDRILEVIPRHLGTLETGTGILHGRKWTDITPNAGTSPSTEPVERTHIFFFDGAKPGNSPSGGDIGPQSCTAANPCPRSYFTQPNVTEIKSIYSDATLFFSPGPFNNFNGDITIPNGLTLFGRTSDFSLPATPGDYPHFYGGFKVNSNVIMEYMNIDGTGTSTDNLGVGITDTGSVSTGSVSNVTLSHLYVHNFTAPANPGGVADPAYGIRLVNSSHSILDTITVSHIYGGNAAGVIDGSVGGTGGNVFGIDLSGSSDPNLSNITIRIIKGGSAYGANASTSSIGGQGGQGGNATGIDLSNSTNAQLSTATIQNIYGGYASGGNSFGSNLINHGGQGGHGGNAYGINLASASGNASLSNISIQEIVGEAAYGGQGSSSTSKTYGGLGGTGGDAIGINAPNSNHINLSDIQIYYIHAGSGNGGYAFNSNTGASLYGGDGYKGGKATGINLANANHDNFSGINTILQIKGGHAYGGYATVGGGGVGNATGGNGGTGGNAYGMNLSSASHNTITGTTISNLYGGNAPGGNATVSSGFAQGGNGNQGGDSYGIVGKASGSYGHAINFSHIYSGTAVAGTGTATGSGTGQNGQNGHPGYSNYYK